MKKTSAGIVAWRRAPQDGHIEVLLGHPGSPLWARRDEGIWSIGKGQYDPATEVAEHAARREWAEETGFAATGTLVPLRPVKLKSGKVVIAWAMQASIDATQAHSNLFTLEWPPRSGRQQQFPEIDRWQWFPLDQAMVKALPGLRPLLVETAQIAAQEQHGDEN